MNPMTSILIKIFVKGFYRANSGMFLFFFVGLITYCFFIEVLNKTHLPASDISRNHLIIVLSIITSPLILMFICLLWLAYSVKTWQYIKSEFGLASNQFLRYSINSLSKINQFRSWLIVQLFLSARIIIYCGFAFAVGLVYGHYWLPVLFMTYIVFIAAISAVIHLRRSNSLSTQNRSDVVIGRAWPKPLWALYVFRILNEQQMGFLITKICSFCVLAASGYLLIPQKADVTVGGIITLAIVVTHSFLIYDSFSFEKAFLDFSRNLPYSKTKVYFDWAFCYMLLTLPESIWILYIFDIRYSSLLLLFNLVTGMFYKNILYKLSANVNLYLRIVLITFSFFFLGILWNLIIPIIAFNLILSILLFYKYYDQQAT